MVAGIAGHTTTPGPAILQAYNPTGLQSYRPTASFITANSQVGFPTRAALPLVVEVVVAALNHFG